MVQTHVTWGKNTVFNPPATPPQSSSTSTSFSFGSTTTTAGAGGVPTTPSTPKSSSTSSFSFGSSTPAAATTTPATTATATSTPSTFSFSSNPISTPSTGIFGSTTTNTPAPTFATTTTTAPISSTPTSSGFFSPTSNPSIQPQPFNTNTNNTTGPTLAAPQQAAIQAHFNATLHQESSRLEATLLQLHAAYSPYQTNTTTTTTSSNNNENTICHFQHIFYDQMTPTQHAEKISLGITNYPQKPNHIPIEIWNKALSHNPNPDQYIPVVITSANGLHTRLVSQQSKMNLLSSYLNQLENVIEVRLKQNRSMENVLKSFIRSHELMKRKLHGIIMKVDLCRGKNIPLQGGELEIMNKLREGLNGVVYLEKLLKKCKYDGERYQKCLGQVEQLRRGGYLPRQQSQQLQHEEIDLNDEYKEEVYSLLNQYGSGIEGLKQSLKKDERDLKIVKLGLKK